MADDDDDVPFGGAYEEGHWVWDESGQELSFQSDVPVHRESTTKPVLVLTTGASEFKELDLIEQMRFRKRFQRKLKPGEEDVIILQDVKDLALYSAPLTLLTPMLINVLHLPTTERFIRALILYCQYYLQTSEVMASRMAELETKVRIYSLCEQLEGEYRENLSDLRVMVAKEYSTMIIGGDDTKKFHHMGASKKLRSLSNKDNRLFETLLRMCIQIVWIALGRRSYNEIEMEVNRLFKSEVFNFVEHTLKTGYMAKMSPEERSVLMGRCVRHDTKMNTCSPLMNEVFCHRPIDYRMLGLGVIRYDELPSRHRYLLRAVAAPEAEMVYYGVICGILGLPRAFFDTSLHMLPTVFTTEKKSKSSIGSAQSNQSKMSASSKSAQSSSKIVGSKKDKGVERKYAYNDIILPPKDTGEILFPPTFPGETQLPRPCNNTQRLRWQLRLYKLLHPPKNRRKSSNR